MKNKSILPPRCRFFWCATLLVATLLIGLPSAGAQSGEKFHYWVDFDPTGSPYGERESFVIEVNAEQAARIESIWNARSRAGFAGDIAAGSVGYNRNYYAPGQPVWNWHVAFVEEIFDFRDTFFPFVVDPNYDDDPSDIAADPEEWIRRNGSGYSPRNYMIRQRVDPNKHDALVNVSNRGMTGAGEKALITGFIIKGDKPRNVVVRALGPSLSSAGVQQVAANPKIEVYSASGRQFAANADWQTDTRSATLRESVPSLAPTNDKEAALLLTLFPGAYTLHGLNEDGAEGVVLLEAYDVDSSSE